MAIMDRYSIFLESKFFALPKEYYICRRGIMSLLRSLKGRESGMVLIDISNANHPNKTLKIVGNTEHRNN